MLPFRIHWLLWGLAAAVDMPSPLALPEKRQEEHTLRRKMQERQQREGVGIVRGSKIFKKGTLRGWKSSLHAASDLDPNPSKTLPLEYGDSQSKPSAALPKEGIPDPQKQDVDPATPTLRIVGGNVVESTTDYPYYVFWGDGCGGSLIAPDVVLSTWLSSIII